MAALCSFLIAQESVCRFGRVYSHTIVWSTRPRTIHSSTTVCWGRTVQLLFGQVYVLVFGQLLRHLQLFGDGLAALQGGVFYAEIATV